MTAMQPQSAKQDASNTGLFGIDLPELDSHSTQLHGMSFGHRLHAAREARSLDLETCAHALRLPVRVLRQLERDECDAIDSKIYLASYIGKYARHLGLDEASIQLELDRIRQVEPNLVATGGISHSRFLLDRYATAATYVVLTAVIVVPMIWLGVRGTLDRSITHLAPLDAAPVAQQDAPAAAGSAGVLPSAPAAAQASALKPMQPENPPQEQPLLASMAPFPNLEGDSVPPPQPAAPAVPAVDSGTGSHNLGLSLTQASWVEVIASDGSRLEYGLLPAGSSKTYRSDQPLDVRIGNATGAQISIDGQPVALSDFRHANVARFRVQMQDGKASAASL